MAISAAVNVHTARPARPSASAREAKLRLRDGARSAAIVLIDPLSPRRRARIRERHRKAAAAGVQRRRSISRVIRTCCSANACVVRSRSRRHAAAACAQASAATGSGHEAIGGSAASPARRTPAHRRPYRAEVVAGPADIRHDHRLADGGGLEHHRDARRMEVRPQRHDDHVGPRVQPRAAAGPDAEPIFTFGACHSRGTRRRVASRTSSARRRRTRRGRCASRGRDRCRSPRSAAAGSVAIAAAR